MRVFNKQAELSTFLQSVAQSGLVGFVPTMGALHQGHLTLLKQSVAENTTTVVSIYVNPTQFNNVADLKSYPRTLELDLEKIKFVDSNIVVFTPETADIYGPEAKSDTFNFDGLDLQMEGKFRPGHFNGMATIVKRLLDIVKPNRAYFGEKDFQQLQIVRKLVQKHHMEVQIIACPIVREENGLAMSSRNERLSAADRAEAAFIFKILCDAQLRFSKHSIKQVKSWVYQKFQKNRKFKLEYFEIADQTTLKSALRKSNNKKYRAFIAVFMGEVRLIDTIALN